MLSELSSTDAVHRTRILLVDDYLDALEMWALYLRIRGYEVITAGDGVTAVEMAEQAHPDLIILDLDLPGIPGVEAAKRIRARPSTSHIPLLAATGHSQQKQIDDAKTAGFESVLVKPCEPAELVKEVERVLALSDPTFHPPEHQATHFG